MHLGVTEAISHRRAGRPQFDVAGFWNFQV